jgi:hypothetical protein
MIPPLTTDVLPSHHLLKNKPNQILKEQQPRDTKKESQQWRAKKAGDTYPQP